MNELNSSKPDNHRHVAFTGKSGKYVSVLRTIFGRLLNLESTVVTSKSLPTKNALIVELMEARTQQAYLGDRINQYVFSLIGLRWLANDFTPEAFWHHAITPLNHHLSGGSDATLINSLRQSIDNWHVLGRFFAHLAESRQMALVLVLDDFDSLLRHPRFQDSTFFANLRSLSTHTGGLALVIASSCTVTEMDDRGRGLLDIGSPFFNPMIEVQLH